jgi:hypothetical protein
LDFSATGKACNVVIMKTFIIDYRVESSIGAILRTGKVKVKNQKDDIGAQINLEKKLKRDVPHFHRMVVLSVKEDIFFGDDDVFNFLNDIWK